MEDDRSHFVEAVFNSVVIAIAIFPRIPYAFHFPPEIPIVSTVVSLFAEESSIVCTCIPRQSQPTITQRSLLCSLEYQIVEKA